MAAEPLAVTGPTELAEQLARPNHEIIWRRATEVFGEFELARDWMNTPLPVLEDQCPEAYFRSGDAEKQRAVLRILVSIEYGMFD